MCYIEIDKLQVNGEGRLRFQKKQKNGIILFLPFNFPLFLSRAIATGQWYDFYRSAASSSWIDSRAFIREIIQWLRLPNAKLVQPR